MTVEKQDKSKFQPKKYQHKKSAKENGKVVLRTPLDTVDGQNPALPRMIIIPLFIRLCRISSINIMSL